MRHERLKRLKSSFSTGANVLFFGFLFVFLLANIFSSQLVSPLYFQLVKEDKNAVIAFLERIKHLPSFLPLLETNKNIFGSAIEQEVFSGDQQRREKIVGLELLLEKNPKSADLLYDLYLLYDQEGNKIKADEYLKRAKEIDPMILGK